ncbi:MAG: enoyl-CoA hydratase/isomerase family protein [Alteromonadaceae bacterium]|nr:enoyl-CoA hydratase/isomerase family protein [Alteromonadaceae bacterium]
MSNLILTAEQNGLFTITLNRFDKKNALNDAMYQQLCQHFEYAAFTDNIHCVLIQGDENCFCAGNDLDDFIKADENSDLAAFKFIKILGTFNKPLVAAVAGAAVGIGTTMLLHCDMVFAATNSKFKLPFTQLGLCPEAASSYLLPLRIGANRAFELMILGDTFSAEQAFTYGLVNKVCSPEELLASAQQSAIRIAQLPSDAVITGRRLIRQASQAQIAQVMNDEANEFFRLVKGKECKNIIAKFFKR